MTRARRVRRSPKGIIHVHAACQDCPWESGNHKTGTDAARRHAKSKGHRVNVDQGVNFEYDGRPA